MLLFVMLMLILFFYVCGVNVFYKRMYFIINYSYPMIDLLMFNFLLFKFNSIAVGRNFNFPFHIRIPNLTTKTLPFDNNKNEKKKQGRKGSKYKLIQNEKF